MRLWVMSFNTALTSYVYIYIFTIEIYLDITLHFCVLNIAKIFELEETILYIIKGKKL